MARPTTFMLRQLMWAIAGLGAMFAVDELGLPEAEVIRPLFSPCSASRHCCCWRSFSLTVTPTRIAGSSSAGFRFSRRNWPSPPSSSTWRTSWRSVTRTSPTGVTRLLPAGYADFDLRPFDCGAAGPGHCHGLLRHHRRRTASSAGMEIKYFGYAALAVDRCRSTS